MLFVKVKYADFSDTALRKDTLINYFEQEYYAPTGVIYHPANGETVRLCYVFDHTGLYQHGRYMSDALLKRLKTGYYHVSITPEYLRQLEGGDTLDLIQNDYAIVENGFMKENVHEH